MSKTIFRTEIFVESHEVTIIRTRPRSTCSSDEEARKSASLTKLRPQAEIDRSPQEMPIANMDQTEKR